MKTEAEFWAAVEQADDGCWLWMRSVDTRGYGNLMWRGKTMRAHRVAYELIAGPIPAGEGWHGRVVMHACDNKRCCNPDHLSLGTHADNMADMRLKQRADRKNGERNGRAILTQQDVAAIRADQRSLRAITADYPVSRSAIQRIKAGRAWTA